MKKRISLLRVKYNEKKYDNNSCKIPYSKFYCKRNKLI